MEERRLDNSERSQLLQCWKNKYHWSRVPPKNADPQLLRWMDEGLVVWIEGRGYSVTEKCERLLAIRS